MIFYMVSTLQWLRFSMQTQTLIAKRVRRITRPSEHFIFEILVQLRSKKKKLDFRSVFVVANIIILVFYTQVQFLFGCYYSQEPLT